MKMNLLLAFCFWVVYGGGELVVMAATDTSESGTQRQLDQTPTWAVAGVCSVMIIISISLEKGLHKFGTVCAFFLLSLLICAFGFLFLCLFHFKVPSFFLVLHEIFIIFVDWGLFVYTISALYSSTSVSRIMDKL